MYIYNIHKYTTIYKNTPRQITLWMYQYIQTYANTHKHIQEHTNRGNTFTHLYNTMHTTIYKTKYADTRQHIQHYANTYNHLQHRYNSVHTINKIYTHIQVICVYDLKLVAGMRISVVFLWCCAEMLETDLAGMRSHVRAGRSRWPPPSPTTHQLWGRKELLCLARSLQQLMPKRRQLADTDCCAPLKMKMMSASYLFEPATRFA